LFRLRNPVKDYAWGTSDVIPRLLGVPASGRPQAELWIGAHPTGPSMAATPGGERPLGEVIAGDPLGTLGAPTASRFGAELPFLLKVLSAAGPLSIQVHPSKEQAEKGYAAEEAAGVPRDSPTRNYRDANHKPELLFALTAFEALSGFKPPAEAVALLSELSGRMRGADVVDDLIEDLDATSEASALRAATERLLTLERSELDATVAAVVAACKDIDDPSAGTAVELHRAFGADAGVLLSLLLNRISLKPGDAIFLPAGNVHAYLRGTGIEVMAASDNVLRGGLTAKHIDVPELLSIVDFTASQPVRPEPVRRSDGETDFSVPVDDFALSVLDLVPGREVHWHQPVPRTAIVVEGDVDIRSSSGAVRLSRGESVFIAAADAPLEISGAGRLVGAFSPT
jgi:mannose-6-phosphate isomerase